MPFLSVKLVPGVHVEQTPLLLQAGVVQSNNIRWRDGLPEKLGGWQKFYYMASDGVTRITPPPVSGPVRELWPWADFNGDRLLAIGGDGGLAVITKNLDITPMFNVTNAAPTFTTVAGSSLVHVLNVDPNVTSNLAGSIVVDNYVSVGGIVLYGAYPIKTIVSVSEVIIDAKALATTTVGAPGNGVVSTFTTNVGSALVVVSLPAHGFSIGQVVSFLPTTLTGSSTAPVADLVVSGSYDIKSLGDALGTDPADKFTIALPNAATNAVTIGENGGNARLTTWVVQSPSAPGAGWGQGSWGEGGWGGVGIVVAPPSGTPVTAAGLGMPGLDWCLVNFGEDLIAQPEGFGFFVWDVDGGLGMARPITDAPLAAKGFFLAMPQQQLVAYGASTGTSPEQDPMLVRWSDNADYHSWVATVANQAGSFRLARGSKIVGGMQTPMQAMLWTDVGLWLMQYIGYPDVWGFNEVAQECGLIAKKAAAVCGGQTFWMSRDKFWTFTGGQVTPLPCEVWDAVYQNLNTNLLDRIRCGANTGFDEVWWFYPSKATQQPGALQENDSYVKFNRVTGEWDYGTPIDVFGGGALGGLMVSDWIDNNVFGHPISAMSRPDGVSSQLMWHEMGHDAGATAMDWWFRTGLFLLSEGEDFIFVDRCRPDFKWRRFQDAPSTTAQVQITLYTQDDPDNQQKPPAQFGPFLCTNASGPFDPRARGRYFSMKVEGNDAGSFARLGSVKFRFCPDGRAG